MEYTPKQQEAEREIIGAVSNVAVRYRLPQQVHALIRNSRYNETYGGFVVVRYEGQLAKVTHNGIGILSEGTTPMDVASLLSEHNPGVPLVCNQQIADELLSSWLNRDYRGLERRLKGFPEVYALGKMAMLEDAIKFLENPELKAVGYYNKLAEEEKEKPYSEHATLFHPRDYVGILAALASSTQRSMSEEPFDYFSRAIKGKSIGEVGCRHGVLLKLLEELGGYPYGIDFSPEAVSRATKEGLDARLGNANKIDSVFADKRPDHLVSLEFFHSGYHIHALHGIPLDLPTEEFAQKINGIGNEQIVKEINRMVREFAEALYRHSMRHTIGTHLITIGDHMLELADCERTGFEAARISYLDGPSHFILTHGGARDIN